MKKTGLPPQRTMGFTLVEILVSLAILSIIGTFISRILTTAQQNYQLSSLNTATQAMLNQIMSDIAGDFKVRSPFPFTVNGVNTTFYTGNLVCPGATSANTTATALVGLGMPYIGTSSGWPGFCVNVGATSAFANNNLSAPGQANACADLWIFQTNGCSCPEVNIHIQTLCRANPQPAASSLNLLSYFPQVNGCPANTIPYVQETIPNPTSADSSGNCPGACITTTTTVNYPPNAVGQGAPTAEDVPLAVSACFKQYYGPSLTHNPTNDLSAELWALGVVNKQTVLLSLAKMFSNSDRSSSITYTNGN